MEINKKVLYTQSHEWVKIDGNIATVGITDFAQSELGDIVFVEIDTEGEELTKESVFGTIEAVKTVSDLHLPIEGKIIEVNEALMDNPDLINKAPYEKGWIIKVACASTDTSHLLTPEQYEKSIQ